MCRKEELSPVDCGRTGARTVSDAVEVEPIDCWLDEETERAVRFVVEAEEEDAVEADKDTDT